ncbi:PREDICTED: uncharacterized protein LOC108369310 [Rhagoletis zephyria]|uniref:uncharacterized protein LOC108369310 n=1 Tax=Rhagoletis zephyria TaxID=28612 RepID=UPI000811A580|nr:PREDICTED: uncharacterized protein LOC108369310 [Rhagoletis zephyria]
MIAPIKKGEVGAREDPNGIVVLKWKDKRDVRMLSTKHAPIMVSTTDGARNPEEPSTSRGARRKRRATEKPLAVVEYNKGKAGIDLSDQMASYSNTLCKGLKWYRKLGIELLLGLSMVNAFTVYKAASNNKTMSIRTFRERVAKDLLGLTCPQPVPQSQHIITKRVDENNKTIRRACVLCYAEAKRKFSRKEARKNIKRTTTYCPQCPNTPQLCIDCFPKYTHLKN